MTSEFTKFACDLIKRAGKRTLTHFRQSVVVDRKDGEDFDPVTVADKQCEYFIRQEIRRKYPSHGIIGEEYDDLVQGRFSWVIDPIDGTRAFISGLLHWGVLLALCDEGQPILGLMYQPFTDELFVGEPDGSWYSRHNQKTTLNTRNGIDLPSATLMTTDPRLFREKSQSQSYQRLENSVRLTRYGGDCYQYAVLSAGSIDLVCENQLNPWDILALIPIVLNAGGSITDWRGGDPTKGGHILASGSCELHEAALEVLDYHD